MVVWKNGKKKKKRCLNALRSSFAVESLQTNAVGNVFWSNCVLSAKKKKRNNGGKKLLSDPVCRSFVGIGTQKMNIRKLMKGVRSRGAVALVRLICWVLLAL